MGFIDGIRNKGQGESPGGGASANGETKKRKRRKYEDMLASVVPESTANAAMDLLSANAPFVLPDGGWVVLALPVDNIGGLSKKHQKDEDKGSLIGLINHDDIQVVTIPELLDRETLAIIPNRQTLERMGEYALLRQANYHWVSLGQTDNGIAISGDRIRAETPVSFADAVAIAEGQHHLADVLPDMWNMSLALQENRDLQKAKGAEEEKGPQEKTAAPPPHRAPPADQGQVAEEPSSAQAEGIDDQQLDTGEEPPHVQEGRSAPQAAFDGDWDPAVSEDLDEEEPELEDELDDEEEDEVEDDDQTSGFAQAGTGRAHEWEHYTKQNWDREFTEEDVRQTVARRFMPEELDLQVPFSDFEATFNTRAPSVQLQVDDTCTDWLGQQVALMAKQANAELEKLHGDHLNEQRRSYVETMSLHAEEVMRAVDPQRPGSDYQRLMEAAAQDHADFQAQAPEEVRAQRKEIIQDYERDANARADVAAAQARQTFWDRHRAEMDAKVAEVASAIERRNEERYAHQREIVLDRRRKEAGRRMEVGITRSFQVLSEREKAHQEAESELLQRWNRAITAVIEGHRKNDIARAAALEEQLELDTRVEKMQAEHARNLEELESGYLEQLRRAKDEQERERARSEERLREREQEWQHALHIKEEQRRSAHDLHLGLSEKSQEMVASHEQQFYKRIAELEHDKSSHEAELERATRIHSRFTKLLIGAGAIGGVLLLAVGFILGWAIR